jgi:hypothetical protein
MTHGQLCDIEAIKNLKARYFRFLDAKQWTDLRGLFTVDGSFEHPALGRFASIDEAVLAVSDRIGDLTTVHHGGLPEITLGGDDDARAIWPMASFTFRASPTAAGSPVGPARTGPGRRTFGHYLETYRRQDGRWLIASLQLVSVYRESFPV